MTLNIFIIIIILIIIFVVFKCFTQKEEIAFTETSLPENMTLHHCPTTHSHQNNNKQRALVVIFGWLLAQDKHLFKYRQFWFKRGFDVMVVKISPLDSLLPPIGSLKVAKNVVKVLSNIDYNEIVVHSFSAGAYQFGEVLVHLFGTSPEKHSILIESIKGVIMDSIVPHVDVAPGMAITLTQNPILRSFIEKSIRLFHQIFYKFTVKHYENSGITFIDPPIKCPGLLFYSRDDVISSYENIEKMIEMRRNRGHELGVKCWDESGHVQHYKQHPKEYEQELDAFLNCLQLKSLKESRVL